MAPDLIRRWLVIVKQGVDLHTSTFNQALAAEYLSGGYLKQHLPKIIDLYKPKQEAMLGALEKHFPNEFQWSHPEGGMFLWVEGPKDLDMEKIYWKSVKKKVAFVPGKYFSKAQSIASCLGLYRAIIFGTCRFKYPPERYSAARA